MDLEEQKIDAVSKASAGKAEEVVASARVNPLDASFLIILLFAMIFDVIFFFLAIFDASVITWIIGMILSPIPLVVIGIWDYKRAGKLGKAKQEASRIKESAQRFVEESKERLKQLAVKGEKKMLKKAGSQMVKKTAVKTGTKVATKTGIRVFVRGVGSCVGTNIPFVGAFPFYTLWVLLTLREK
jgi:ABC-type multidrug transport system fused ATPase/permease subunit